MNHPQHNRVPFTVSPIHFVGIGGIGMSGIAELMLAQGYTVQGSDLSESYNTERLRSKGVTVHIGQKAEHVGDARVVVISSAVKSDNPEVQAARARGIPVVRRAEMLAELMRLKATIAVAGTHGKTTTTSMVATVLEGGDLDPTVINGGIINDIGTNVRVGQGEWMVVEADESDGTFIKIPATVAIITNMDPEHLEQWQGSFEVLKAAFRSFVENIPFYGFGVLCIDHPVVQELAASISDRKIVTYGLSPQADVRAVNLRRSHLGSVFDVAYTLDGGQHTLESVHLPVLGEHNVLNSLAAISVGLEFGIGPEAIKAALGRFAGVKRRFTLTGQVAGITVVDDYGHHPAEISATLKAARQFVREPSSSVIAVVQPHRYTRLRDLFHDFCTCFNDADTVIVADVYAAGEAPIEGFNRDTLVQGLKNHRHKHVIALEDKTQLPDLVSANAKAGDVVICLGAGSITYWAAELPQQLENLLGMQSRKEVKA